MSSAFRALIIFFVYLGQCPCFVLFAGSCSFCPEPVAPANRHRRVIHLEFNCLELPGDLAWGEREEVLIV